MALPVHHENQHQPGPYKGHFIALEKRFFPEAQDSSRREIETSIGTVVMNRLTGEAGPCISIALKKDGEVANNFVINAHGDSPASDPFGRFEHSLPELIDAALQAKPNLDP